MLLVMCYAAYRPESVGLRDWSNTDKEGGYVKTFKSQHVYLLLVIVSCLVFLMMLMNLAWSPSQSDSVGGASKFSAPPWSATPNAPYVLFLPLDHTGRANQVLWIFETFRTSSYCTGAI